MTDERGLSEKSNGDRLDVRPGPQTPATYDEIDLVGLWIHFWIHRKKFLLTLIVTMAIGFGAFELLKHPKSMSKVRSILVVKATVIDGKVVTAMSNDVLSKRIEFVLLPRVALLQKFNQVKSIVDTTSVKPIEMTGMIEIVSIGPNSVIDDMKQFHVQLVDEILSDVRRSSFILPVDTNNSFTELNDNIAAMQLSLSDLELSLKPDVETKSSLDNPPLLQTVKTLNALGRELNLLSTNMKYLQNALLNFEPGVIVKAQVSGKSAGIKRLTAYVIIVALAGFLAISVIVVAIFVVKVRNRMANEG